MRAAPEIRVLQDAQELAREAAEFVVWLGAQRLAAASRFHLCLTGGSTPRLLYETLASPPFAGQLDWGRVEVYFGDERAVPPDDAASNYRMAAESLLRPLGIAEDRIFRMHGEREPEAAAQDYERILRARVPAAGGWPRFDLLLLGLGEDGHVASLFPGGRELTEDRRAVVATTGPTEPRRRISLTLPVLNQAAVVLFLVSGTSKAQAVRRVLDPGSPGDRQVPAAYVRPVDGRLIWMLDRAAAHELPLVRQSVVSHEE